MKITLKSEKRDIFGRKVSRLRKAGKIPANIFGKKIESSAILVDNKEFTEVFEKAGETQIIDLGGKPVLVSNTQVDPISGEYLHVDFRQVDLKEKIEAKVPVEVEGESPAEKQNLGTVVQQLHEIEVEALPADLPEKIMVDASLLTEVDQVVYVKDLKVNKDVEIKTDLESIVVKVEPPQKEEVVEVAPAPVEGEVSAEGTKPAEGETPKEEVKE
ncbi:MAG: 50S ribosomal protein L25 [Microgenomates group bacterium]